MHDGRFMRYDKRSPRTLAMLTDGAVPVRADGAIDLCQTCQRRAWYAGGYLSLLTKRLANVAEIVGKRQRLMRKLRRLNVGEGCGDVFRSGREEAVTAAKEIADELGWTIFIQRRGWESLRITRLAASADTRRMAETALAGSGRSPSGAVPKGDAQ